MIEFQDISEIDEEKAKSCLAKSQYRNCEYSFINNLAWRRLADSRAAFWGGFYLVCSFDTESRYPEFTYPAGEGNFDVLLAEMESFAEMFNAPLIIKSVDKSKLDYFTDKFGDDVEILSDEGDSDYIYLREDLAELKGKKYHGKRNHIAQFKKTYNWEYRELRKSDFDDILYFSANLYNDKNGYDVRSEIAEQFAINTFLERYDNSDLKGGVLLVDGKIIAYTIGEPISDDTFGVHIEKADVSYHGSYAMINNCFSSSIDEKYIYLNREEDLGIEGLRKAKHSYYPNYLLEKYTVIINQD